MSFSSCNLFDDKVRDNSTNIRIATFRYRKNIFWIPELEGHSFAPLKTIFTNFVIRVHRIAFAVFTAGREDAAVRVDFCSSHRTDATLERDEIHAVRLLPSHDKPCSYVAVVSSNLSVCIALTSQELLKFRDFPVCPCVGASYHEIVCKLYITIAGRCLRSMATTYIHLCLQLSDLGKECLNSSLQVVDDIGRNKYWRREEK